MNCTIKFLGKTDDRRQREKSEKDKTQIISTSGDNQSERGNKCLINVIVVNIKSNVICKYIIVSIQKM